MAETVTCKCKICKKEFEARVADRKRGWAKCCSKKCAAVRRERNTGNCAAFYLRLREQKKGEYLPFSEENQDF